MKLITTAIFLSIFLCVPEAYAQFSSADYPVGTDPIIPVFADFDGNGDEDMAVTNSDSTNSGSGDVSVLENTSDGFSAVSGSPFETGNSPVGLVVADLDGDGNADLATANEADPTAPNGNVTVLLNGGAAAFTAQTVPNEETGPDPYGIVAADFDGDADVDLAVTNRTDPGTVTVLQNDGSGNFTEADQVSVGSQPRLIAAGDFDGDGRVDLASADNESDSVSILENTSTADSISFSNAATVAVGDGPSGIVAGDLTGDGQADLAVTNGVAGTVSILDNTSTGPGSFGFSETTEDVGANPFGITAGEFDGQAGTDLAVVNNDDNDVSFLLNDGAGTFSRFGSDEPVGTSPFGIASADLNADGITDLAVANFDDEDVSVLQSEAPLPVELAGDFAGAADGRDVVLTWTTLSEKNNEHFRILQKQDGTFVEVGTEASKVMGSTTQEAQQYRHRVENVAPGRYVFHLMQVDTDGTEHFGAETTVEVTPDGSYHLSSAYPNPFSSSAQLTLTVVRQQQVRVAVFDMLGRRVRLLHDGPLAASEPHTLRLERGALSSGTYLIRIEGDFFNATRQVVLVK